MKVIRPCSPRGPWHVAILIYAVHPSSPAGNELEYISMFSFPAGSHFSAQTNVYTRLRMTSTIFAIAMAATAAALPHDGIGQVMLRGTHLHDDPTTSYTQTLCPRKKDSNCTKHCKTQTYHAGVCVQTGRHESTMLKWCSEDYQQLLLSNWQSPDCSKYYEGDFQEPLNKCYIRTKYHVYNTCGSSGVAATNQTSP
eukprot:TRINITY_DN455_c0_g1_i6.p1 TRINITY_DN455_c0_g1~~TRINITY_DN455_c0_g1_i6.p1  ORF type:complete len:196 (+),score=8.85 TRINITY_DN455_c0_g1_i6:800-1387(+)